MTPVGFEPTISAGERPQTYALDRAATGTGTITYVTASILKADSHIACRALIHTCQPFPCPAPTVPCPS